MNPSKQADVLRYVLTEISGNLKTKRYGDGSPPPIWNEAVRILQQRGFEITERKVNRMGKNKDKGGREAKKPAGKKY